MRRTSTLVLLLALVPTTLSQFGNAFVQWDANAVPTVHTPGLPAQREYIAPSGKSRRESLLQLDQKSLIEILSKLDAETCMTCETNGHYISKIRAACLGLGPKGLKQQLLKRGVKCDGCTMREHYLDKVLDTIHLMPK